MLGSFLTQLHRLGFFWMVASSLALPFAWAEFEDRVLTSDAMTQFDDAYRSLAKAIQNANQSEGASAEQVKAILSLAFEHSAQHSAIGHALLRVLRERLPGVTSQSVLVLTRKILDGHSTGPDWDLRLRLWAAVIRTEYGVAAKKAAERYMRALEGRGTVPGVTEIGDELRLHLQLVLWEEFRASALLGPGRISPLLSETIRAAGHLNPEFAYEQIRECLILNSHQLLPMLSAIFELVHLESNLERHTLDLLTRRLNGLLSFHRLGLLKSSEDKDLLGAGALFLSNGYASHEFVRPFLNALVDSDFLSPETRMRLMKDLAWNDQLLIEEWTDGERQTTAWVCAELLVPAGKLPN